MMSLWQRRACTRPYPSPMKLCPICPQRTNRTSPERPTVPSQSADPNTYDLLGPRSPGIARHNLAATGQTCPKLSKIIWTQILSLLPFRLYLFRLLLPDFEVSENASLCRTTSIDIYSMFSELQQQFILEVMELLTSSQILSTGHVAPMSNPAMERVYWPQLKRHRAELGPKWPKWPQKEPVESSRCSCSEISEFIQAPEHKSVELCCD